MSQAIDAGIATSQQVSQAVRETKGDSLGKSDFLQLLVTQFKYQDPLDPMDDKEFVAQLAQFSSLEQLINLNTSMDGLTSASHEQQTMNAAGYLGKEVEAGGNSVSKKDDGQVSKFYYANGEDIAGGSIYVYDQNMQLVYGEQIGPKSASTYVFEWTGKNSAGESVDPGVYYVRMSALNAKGETVMLDSAVTGTVESVLNYDGSTYLRLDDGRTVALADVRRVTALSAPVADNAAEEADS